MGLNINGAPTDEDRLRGNSCRCGTYYRLRCAIHRAAGCLMAEA